MLPTLPHELTTEILRVATLSLVEQERHDSTLTGETNAFLLSASLVSHTWRNIAQALLLRHGLVDPSRALHYIDELARAGFKGTLDAVRIGVPASRKMSAVDARAGGIGMRRILEALPALRDLEFVGQRLRIQGLVVAPNPVTTLSFAALSQDNFEALLVDLRNAFNPLRLTIVEDRDPAGDSYIPRVPWEAALAELKRMLQTTLYLDFTFISMDAGFYPNHLMTAKSSQLPKAGVQSNSNVYPENKIVNHISNLAALKELEVPDCWRSDAIEDACEAKGIFLTWSSKCVSSSHVLPRPFLLAPSFLALSKRRNDDEDDGGGDEDGGPPAGVGEIDAEDYFLKSVELKVWLDEEKGKRLDQLSGTDARKYFKKFCRAWNKGRLSPKFYSGISASSISSSISSGYSWSFSKASQRELDDASSIRKSIDSTGGRAAPPSAGPRPTLGPMMPPSSSSAMSQLQDTRSEREKEREWEKEKRKKDAREGREEERDGRATGRDRVMEKRREANAGVREMKEAREGGGMVEVDDATLMGSGGSFAAMVAARDRSKTTGRRGAMMEEKAAVMKDKVKEYRTKEDDTMAMFRQLAAERFGPK
ncbi:hypothetical protein RQP46_007974 [Phenoliferia psychrophenolica]